MITVAIVGAFLVLVLMRYTHPLAVGQANAISAQLTQIGTALDMYNIDKGSYPAGSGVLSVATFGGANNQYMNNVPATTSGSTYTYTGPTSGADYFICTTQFVVDGSAIPNVKKGDGTVPTAGTSYKLCYSPNVGMYAQ